MVMPVKENNTLEGELREVENNVLLQHIWHRGSFAPVTQRTSSSH